MQKVNQAIDRSTNKTYTVGDKGIFTGSLIGEKSITLTGEIESIIETDNYAIIRIKTNDGVKMLRI